MHAGLMQHDFEYHGTALYRRQMLLRLIGEKWFLLLFAASTFAGTLLNNFLSDAPAIGISAAVLGMLSCALYPYGRRADEVFVHSRCFASTAVPLIRRCGVYCHAGYCRRFIGMGIFCSLAHLGGFAAGGVVGWLIFRRRPRRRVVVTLH